MSFTVLLLCGRNARSIYKSTVNLTGKSKFITPFKPNTSTFIHKPATIKQRCVFHTSSRRHLAVPPLVWVFLKPALKIGAIIYGRLSRSKWHALPKEKKKEYAWGIVTALSLAFGVYFVYHLEEVPITKRYRFRAHTPSQFQKIVEYEAQNLVEKNKELIVPAHHPCYSTIIRTIYRILKGNKDMEELKSHKWTVYVLSDKSVNASVLPNGYVFVHTGLLEFVQNEDQLAIILGHEMAHAILEHTDETLSFTQLIDWMVIVLMAAIWMLIPNDGIAFITQWYYNKCLQVMLHMPYSRKLESEADSLGLRLCAKACYDVREGSVFWKRMQYKSKLEGGERFEWLSTHPLSEKRADNIDYLLPKVLPLRDECHCSPLPSQDPREKLQVMTNVLDNVIVANLSRQNLSKMTVVHTDVKKKKVSEK